MNTTDPATALRNISAYVMDPMKPDAGQALDADIEALRAAGFEARPGEQGSWSWRVFSHESGRLDIEFNDNEINFYGYEEGRRLCAWTVRTTNAPAPVLNTLLASAFDTFATS